MAVQLSTVGQGGGTSGTIGIVVALPAEFKPLKRHFTFTPSGKRQVENQSIRVFRSGTRGASIVAAITGVGARSAALATQLLLNEYAVAGVLCAGLAGALSEELEPGDIVVAQDTLAVPCPNASDATLTPYASDPEWHKLALSLGDPDQRTWSGRVVTSERVITSAAEKRRVGRSYDALAVDMESAGVARVAHERRTPFLAVRAISDNARDDLPDVVARWGGGSSEHGRGERPGRAFPSPREAVRLVRLGLAARSACSQLADVVARLVHATFTQDSPGP